MENGNDIDTGFDHRSPGWKTNVDRAGTKSSRDNAEARTSGRLKTILGIVKTVTGHDFSSYKANTMLRRIERRMTINGISDHKGYIALLKENSLEAEALCREFLIGVTSFFRDPEAFESLWKVVIPKLFTGRDPSCPVRVWHACCSTGEEAYSTAMLIREYLDERNLDTTVRIFATDLDEESIARAREGTYSGDIRTDVGEQRLTAFFTRRGDSFQVAKRLREMIVFARHNLIKDPPFSRLDLVVCRNFLIYLDAEMQGRLISLFRQVLKPGGFLFLGGSESAGRHSDLFVPVDKTWKIYELPDDGRSSGMLFPHAAPVPVLTGAAGQSSGGVAEKPFMERNCPSNNEFVSINEAYQSTNEELLAANEELKTSKEELQAANEELAAINSELQLAAQALRESEARYCGLFENMLEGFAYCKMVFEGGKPHDFTYLMVNQTFETLTGLKNVVGKRVTEVIPDIRDTNRELFEICGGVSRTGKPERFEIYVEALKMWFSVSVYSPERGFFVAVFDVVTERKNAEEVLRLSEARLNRSQEIAHLGSWELDLTTNELIWSDEVYRIFGLPPREFGATYEAFLERIHPEDRAAVDAAYWGSVRDGSDSYEIEHRVVRKGTGEVRWVHEKCEHTRDESGRIIRSVGMVHDITERRQTEEALRLAKEAAETATRAKSRFLANMSHELRTPMNGVLGMLEHALNGPLENEQREFIEMAHKSAGSLLRILNDILDLTRVEAGKFTMEENPFDLRECVSGAVEILIPEARRKGLRLMQTVAAEVPEIVVGDQVRLTQVLTNLIGNAVKFTERGKVEARVEAGAETVDGRRKLVFTVSDTGIGIPAHGKDALFRPFSQVDDTNTRRYGGTGLGLAICREIVERMGGHISVESEEGVGSRFTFTVMVGDAGTRTDAAAASVARPEPARDRYAGWAGLRILVAEDDPVGRQVLKILFKRQNLEPDFAADGSQAVEKWERGEYDLIFMDVQMPRMDGFEATRVIRAREAEQGGRTPIIAMTAHAFAEDEQRCLEAGMDAYLAKPIDFRKCMDLIEAIVG